MRTCLAKATSIFAASLALTPFAIACEISLTPDKETYQVGEVAVVTADILDTHRNCTLKGTDPKLNASGLELTAKTKFKEKSPGQWTIKYKLKVLDAKNQFTVFRDGCQHEGGTKSITLKLANSGAGK